MADILHAPVTPVSEPEGYAEKAAEIVAKSQALPKDPTPDPAVPSNPERPQWLPEKFKSVEDMAKAYSELEKKLSGGKAKEPEVAKDAPVQENPKTEEKPAEVSPETQEASDVLKAAGLDLNDFSAEFSQKGELTPESYEKLTKAGFPKELVDSYIEGQKAVAERNQLEVLSEIGGQQRFDELVGWATKNLTPAEIDEYNQAVDGGKASAIAALKKLDARFKDEVGDEPKLVRGTTAPVSSDAFRSVHELSTAMRDPRYKANDPAYHAEINRRLANSKLF